MTWVEVKGGSEVRERTACVRGGDGNDSRPAGVKVPGNVTDALLTVRTAA
jgi:hypothetical protein